jgi:signal transduction histidine kinase
MSEDTRQAARGILAECETLGAVIRRFTDFVKNETLNPLDFDLGRLLSRIAGREGRSQPGATLVLPEGECGTLHGDEELLERAFENLVRNAREAAGPSGHVWIDVLRDGGLVNILISDDGPGMSTALSQGIRPFFTTKPGGLGLGLPIVQKIVSLHGGDVRFESRSPRGLRVVVRLPSVGASVTEGNG